MPVSVSVPVPVLTSEPPVPPPAPPSAITPLTVVDVLSLPTVKVLAPREKVPAPAIEPAESWLLAFGPVLCEKSIVLPALFMNAALPPVLFAKNVMVPVFAADPLVIVADPPVLLFWNVIVFSLVIITLLLPAEAEAEF